MMMMRVRLFLSVQVLGLCGLVALLFHPVFFIGQKEKACRK